MGKMILNVGDVVFSESVYHGIRKYTISRVTPKRAFVKLTDFCEARLKREYSTGNYGLTEVPRSFGFGSTHWSIKDDDIATKYTAQKFEQHFREQVDLISKLSKQDLNISKPNIKKAMEQLCVCVEQLARACSNNQN